MITSPIYTVKFAVLLTLQIPSILVSILIFAYFGYYRHTRVKDHNRSILLLLLINFLQVTTDLPMVINFFRLSGTVQPAVSPYCIWWVWFEFSLNTTNGFLMAWISFERHLLIFHSNVIRGAGPWKRRLMQIFPLVICSFWGPMYYLLTVVISPMCTSTWFFDSLLCGVPCYLTTSWGTFDLFFDVIFPVIIIFLTNLALFLRVVYRQTMVVGRIQNNWKRQRKMAIQLGMISFVYLAVWIPLSIAQLGQIYISPSFLAQQLDTFNFLVYIVPLILPFLCLISMSELIETFKTILIRRPMRGVRPLDNTIARNNVNSYPSANLENT